MHLPAAAGKAIEPEILLLGIGNLLMGDEGIGVHVARLLEQESFPAHVHVLEGGTGGFHLMSYFTQYPTVLLIDATLDGGVPGARRLVKPRFAAEFPRSMSTHDIGLKDLMDGLQILGKLPEVHVLAVSIKEVQPMKIGLSPELEVAIPFILEDVRAFVRERVRQEVSDSLSVGLTKCRTHLVSDSLSESDTALDNANN